MAALNPLFMGSALLNNGSIMIPEITGTVNLFFDGGRLEAIL